MNQNIIFSDNEYYNDQLQQVEFQAQCQGHLIRCIISWKVLKKLNEQSNTPIKANEQLALVLFDSVRFEIEDIAEELINQQAFNAHGEILITP